MLRLRTKVTASPAVRRRRSSATSATLRTSGPRAEKRVTISASPTSWPRATPASTSATAPPAAAPGRRQAAAPSPSSSAGGGSSPPEHQAASRARPSASAASSTGKRSAGSSQRAGLEGERRGRWSGGAPGCGRPPRWPARRRSRAGQARSGFTWSAVTGETPPQSSMPAASSGARSSDRFGGAWTWTSGGSTRRATAMAHCRSSGGQGAARDMAVPGLGRKFWTITSCTWPWRAWEAAMARSAASWSARVVADAHQDAGGEGDGQLAGGLEGGQAPGRLLVGRAAVGVEVVGQRLEHHPLAGRHGPQRGQLVARRGRRRWRGGAGRSPRAPARHMAAR